MTEEGKTTAPQTTVIKEGLSKEQVNDIVSGRLADQAKQHEKKVAEMKAEYEAKIKGFETQLAEGSNKIAELEPQSKELIQLKGKIKVMETEDKLVSFGCDPKSKKDIRILAQANNMLVDAEGNEVEITEEVVGKIKESYPSLWGSVNQPPKKPGTATLPGRPTGVKPEQPQFDDNGKMNLSDTLPY